MTGTLEPAAPAPDAIWITFTSSQAEQIAATRAILKARPNWHAMTLFWGIVPVVLAIRAGVKEGLSATVFELGLIAAAGLMFWNYGMAWLAVRGARRGVRNPDGPFTWTLDDAACRLEGPGIDVSLAWTTIVETKETPEAFLLYISELQAYAIPRRTVSDADVPRLRALLARAAQPAAA